MVQAPSTLPWAALAMAELLRLRASTRTHLPNASPRRPNIQLRIKRKPNRVAKLPKGGSKCHNTHYCRHVKDAENR
jgi:hypothetical protein